MDLFKLLNGIGGLALFLYGMTAMGDGLSNLSGGRMERMLAKLTSTKGKALLLGTLVTAVIQSSSATTVMVVGFVNSGIMQLGQAVGVIMGANIGTTITSWMLSLTGISGSSLFLKLLKPSSFSPILAVIGVVLLMTSKGNKKKNDIGNILVGFAILMFGMETMSSAVAPLAENESFTRIFLMFTNPILGMIAGAVLTAVIQSSSASVGILQALCATGAVGYGAAIPIIMGQNIGTCVTAILSSVGANKNAKRASMIHLYFNLIGTIVFMVGFYSLNMMFHFEFLDDSASAVGIAVIHSCFNIGCAMLLYPFTNLLVKLAKLTIKGSPEEEEEENTMLPVEFLALDDRFLMKPAYAMELSRHAAFMLAEYSERCIFLALDILREYNKDAEKEIRRLEDQIDICEKMLGQYLLKISARELSEEDSRGLSVLFQCISDFERISDHALHILDSYMDMRSAKLEFSKEATEELETLLTAIHEIVEKTVTSFCEKDAVKVNQVIPMEECIDHMSSTLMQNHIARVRLNHCTIELGVIYEDIINSLERIANHCKKVGTCMIEVQGNYLPE